MLCVDNPRDVIALYSHLRAIASSSGFSIEELGHVGEDPIVLLRPIRCAMGPSLLVAAGFHGEEPAGCWGLLNFLEINDHVFFEQANLSFLPLVNPSGIRRGQRCNEWGENPNGEYCHTATGYPNPSREGRILLDHMDLILNCAQDGFISLHEDIDCTEFYLYSFEESEAPGAFSRTLRDAEARHFKPQPDGILEGAVVRQGIIFRHCDGSFEDLLFHKGVPRTACTETPGKLDMASRIVANTTIIEAFVRYHLKV